MPTRKMALKWIMAIPKSDTLTIGLDALLVDSVQSSIISPGGCCMTLNTESLDAAIDQLFLDTPVLKERPRAIAHAKGSTSPMRSPIGSGAILQGFRATSE